jgi:hypothetical protein
MTGIHDEKSRIPTGRRIVPPLLILAGLPLLLGSCAVYPGGYDYYYDRPYPYDYYNTYPYYRYEPTYPDYRPRPPLTGPRDHEREEHRGERHDRRERHHEDED